MRAGGLCELLRMPRSGCQKIGDLQFRGDTKSLRHRAAVDQSDQFGGLTPPVFYESFARSVHSRSLGLQACGSDNLLPVVTFLFDQRRGLCGRASDRRNIEVAHALCDIG